MPVPAAVARPPAVVLIEIMELTLYWFMLPTCVAIATAAMLSGIGGAALLVPIVFIVFPALGPEYPLSNAAAVIGVALFTQFFGFMSGLLGYLRRRLIDFGTALSFIAVAAPTAVIGALATQRMQTSWLTGGYALLMLILGVLLIRRREPPQRHHARSTPADDDRPARTLVGRDGVTYTYPVPRQGRGALLTALGALLTGMLSVGIGEVVVPQLTHWNRVPVPVAAATSVFVVFVVVAAASLTQISAVVAAGGIDAVPWNLVMYTVPGVIIGGQIGPRLHGYLPQSTMVRGIGMLFVVIAAAMAVVTLTAAG